MGAGGTKLGRMRPDSRSWAIQTASLTSVLRPGTWAIWVALARTQVHASSRT
jgi:hypothetical protein